MTQCNFNNSDFDVLPICNQVIAGVNYNDEGDYDDIIEVALSDLEDWIGKQDVEVCKGIDWITRPCYGLEYYYQLDKSEQKQLLYDFFKEKNYIS